MKDQFPNDEIDGKQRAVIHIWSAALAPHESSELASRVADLMQNVSVTLEGFVEGRVYEADDGKSVTVMTSWKTRHFWANAIWDQRVDVILESLQSGAKTLDVMCYERAAVVPTAP